MSSTQHENVGAPTFSLVKYHPHNVAHNESKGDQKWNYSLMPRHWVQYIQNRYAHSYFLVTFIYMYFCRYYLSLSIYIYIFPSCINWSRYRSPVNYPHKGQWRGALLFSLICVWINGWVNNREAGDLRRYRVHYDVIVMFIAGAASLSAWPWQQGLLLAELNGALRLFHSLPNFICATAATQQGTGIKINAWA